jgi:hypothetical protein
MTQRSGERGGERPAGSERPGAGRATQSDPLQALRDWLDRAERRLNERLAERSARDDMSRVRGRLSEIALDVQKVIWGLWGRYFQSINLPTRTDILRLGRRLAELEESIARIDAQLRKLETPQPRATDLPSEPNRAHRPPRTRRPPAGSQKD